MDVVIFVVAGLLAGAVIGFVVAGRRRTPEAEPTWEAAAPDEVPAPLPVPAQDDSAAAAADEAGDDLSGEIDRLAAELAAGRQRIDELETELRRFRRWVSDQMQERSEALAAAWKVKRLSERVDELPREIEPEVVAAVRDAAGPLARWIEEFGLGTPEIQFQLGLLDAVDGRLERAATRFQEAAHGGVRPEGWLALGDTNWILGRFKKAARAYEQCREAKRMPTRLFERLAEVLISEHRNREGLDVLAAALGRTTASEHAFLLAARAHLELGDLEATVKVCEDGLALHGDSARLRAAMILPLTRLGQTERAEGCARKALELVPDLPEVPVALGVAKLEKGDIKGARASLREALDRDSEFAEAHFHLGVIANRQANYKSALEHFRAATRTRPDYAEAYLHMKDSYEGLRDFDNAIAMLNKAVQLNPEYA